MSAPAGAALEPSGPRPRRLGPARVGIYAVLVLAAALFLLPLWVTLVTSLETMDEIRLGDIAAWPAAPTLAAWAKAWSTGCTGLACTGISVGYWASIRILVPSVAGSIALGAITGYAMVFYRVPGAGVLGIRPEHLRLGEAVPGRPAAAGTVEVIEPLGAETIAWTRLAGRPAALRLAGDSAIRPGDAIAFTFDPARASLFDAATGERP